MDSQETDINHHFDEIDKHITHIMKLSEMPINTGSVVIYVEGGKVQTFIMRSDKKNRIYAVNDSNQEPDYAD